MLRSKLVAAGFDKLLKQADDRIAALATQLVRPLTQKFVESHLKDVGLEPEFGTHTRMGAHRESRRERQQRQSEVSAGSQEGEREDGL